MGRGKKIKRRSKFNSGVFTMNAITPTQKSAVEKSDVSGNATKLIDRMFTRLKSLFPAWKQAFDSIETYNETKQVWLEELIKADVMTPLTLKRGLDRAAGSESPFFPSVGQFIAWCEFESYHELGLPTLEELEQRLKKYFGYAKEPHNFNFRSPAEYWLLSELYRNYSKKKWEDCQKAMPRILAQAVVKVRSGDEFEPIPIAIEEKTKVIDRQVAIQGVARLKTIMGVN